MIFVLVFFLDVNNVDSFTLNNLLFLALGGNGRASYNHSTSSRSDFRSSKSVSVQVFAILSAFRKAKRLSELVAFSRGEVYAIFTVHTLRTAGDSMRANLRYLIYSTSGRRQLLLIDTDVYEGCRNKQEHDVIINEVRHFLKNTNTVQ